jgi:hypothetical protein
LYELIGFSLADWDSPQRGGFLSQVKIIILDSFFYKIN